MSNEIQEKIAEAFNQWAQERVDNAQRLLRENDIQNGSLLGQSIQTTNMKLTGFSYEIGFLANDYYKFVDQGVKGIGGGLSPKKNSGVYKFKNKNIAPDMVTSLADWMVRKGIVAEKKKAMIGVKTQGTTGVKKMGTIGFTMLIPQKAALPKRKKWDDLTKQERNKRVATGMAISIKMNGLRQTDFWSNTFNEKEYDNLAKMIEDKLEMQINLTLKIE